MKMNNTLTQKRGLGEIFELSIPGVEDSVTKFPTVEEVTEWKEIKDRRIVINEIVTDEIMYYSRLIMQWNKEDYDDNIPVERRQPIKIFLNTYGGDLDAGMSFYNILQISNTPIYIYNMGVCASAGILIFLSGHKRFAVKGSKFLIHEGEVGLGGQTTKVIENLEAIKKQEKDIETYIISKTKIDKKLYSKNKKREWWIVASDSVELGISDKIIESMEEMFQ